MYKNIKLLKNVNEINNSLNKSCYISNTCFTEEDFKHNNVIRLNCGHTFKYDYFMRSRYYLNQNIYTHSRCPYCMCNLSKIPFIINKYTYRNKN